MSDESQLQEKYEKKIYDLQQLLEISRSLCSTIEFSKLIESILYICMGQLRTLGAGIFVLEAIDSDLFVLGSNYSGIDLDPNVSYKIDMRNPLVEVLNKAETSMTLAELKGSVPPETNLSAIESLHPSLIVPLLNKNHLNGILVLGERISFQEDDAYSEYEQELVLGIASLAAIAISNAVLLERSSTDMMTHLKLKYFFFNVLTDKLDTALSQGTPLAVVMFDIDYFKRFNDTYGHACGDYVLQTVAKLLMSNIRAQDLAARYGGEEFTLLLNNTGKNDALIVADRIRNKIEQFDFVYEGQHVQVTISVGVAEFDSVSNPVASPKELVDQADKALYFSKRSGRNRVTFADKKIISEIEVPE